MKTETSRRSNLLHRKIVLFLVEHLCLALFIGRDRCVVNQFSHELGGALSPSGLGPHRAKRGQREGFNLFYLRANARIWPRLSYKCQTRARAVEV